MSDCPLVVGGAVEGLLQRLHVEAARRVGEAYALKGLVRPRHFLFAEDNISLLL